LTVTDFPAVTAQFDRYGDAALQTILLEQERIKRDTIKQRRLKHHSKAA